MLIRFKEAIDSEDLTSCMILRRGLENWSPFLEHHLAIINLQETNHTIEFSRDPEFPNLKPIWSERERRRAVISEIGIRADDG